MPAKSLIQRDDVRGVLAGVLIPGIHGGEQRQIHRNRFFAPTELIELVVESSFMTSFLR